MSRADGKLFELLADEVCRAILRVLLRRGEPTTQRQLTAELPFNSSTISRRMAELVDGGLVTHTSGHAPYSVVHPSKTRELLLAGADLAQMAHQSLADAAALDARELRKAHLTASSTPVRGEGSA
jgi:DNA-binding IclR family transcriptional regulator